MNKAIWIFFALLVIATGALAWHFLAPRVAETSVPVSPKHQPPPSLLGTGGKKPAVPALNDQRPPPAPAVTGFRESSAMQESRKRLAESMSRITPEMRRTMIDLTMRSREPHYRQLFESWNLDPAAAEETLRILRDREVSHSDLRTKYMGDASTDMSAYMPAIKAASSDAEARLLAVIGQDRLMELVQEEERMKAESMARVRERMERSKD